jgi:phospholipid/cholesterol/gamma-HCH transport system permease protein
MDKTKNNQSHGKTAADVAIVNVDSSTLKIVFSGSWLLQNNLPASHPIRQMITASTGLNTVCFDCQGIVSWDTGLLIYLARVFKVCEEAEIKIDKSGLPEGVRTLLKLASAMPEIDNKRKDTAEYELLKRVGFFTLRVKDGFIQGIEFIGDVILSVGRLIRGKAQFRPVDLLLIIEEVGPKALPVVSLVSFLIGLILAYMGAAQLERVGAEIFIADLVAIGMTREIAALMTGVIMSGRTGAAYAAELGTMNVNEEIDAFKILGISIIDFLVLPRFLALVLMIPLLTLYAGLVGILAGMVVSVLVFDFSAFEYYQQTIRALELKQFGVGLFKGTVYGSVVALAGCLRGLQCGRSALAVGQAATSAVVTSIVFIVITASAMTIVFYKLGI